VQKINKQIYQKKKKTESSSNGVVDIWCHEQRRFDWSWHDTRVRHRFGVSSIFNV